MVVHSKKQEKMTLSVIGCGNMGGALLRSWVNRPDIGSIYIVDPSGVPDDLKDSKIAFHVKRAADIEFESCDLVVLAVKPQIMEMVCTELANIKPVNVPVLSIAAGVTISNFQSWLGAETPVIRSMPNTPASIGQGISALCTNKYVNDEIKALSEQLLSAAGKTVWIEDEEKMDAVTAISGSGPAYVFYFIEALTKAAIEIGLPQDVAEQLARQTVVGAGALAGSNNDITASTLRENVTSPGGTTAAALDVFMDGRLQDIVTEAAQAAEKRGKELSS